MYVVGILIPWSSLVEGDEGSYLANSQTNLVIALHALAFHKHNSLPFSRSEL